MLDYELGHLHFAMETFKSVERRDPAEILPDKLPDPFPYESNRDFVRETLKKEVDLRAKDGEFVSIDQESEATRRYRDRVNKDGSPSETVAAGYQWAPGTELHRK